MMPILDKLNFIQGTPEMDPEHAKAIGEAKTVIMEATELLVGAAEALDRYTDVNDGDGGPVPNAAMSAQDDIIRWLERRGVTT